MTREDFFTKVETALTAAIKEKKLDAWFFNEFDTEWAGKDNCEINKVLNAVIPGNWQMIELSGNWTNVGLGIFYEKDYDMYLDLACYDEEEEYIDEFHLYDKCPFKFDEETLRRIENIRNTKIFKTK